MERDREVNQKLRVRGWTVLQFWDVDINKKLDECVRTVKEAIMEARVEDVTENYRKAPGEGEKVKKNSYQAPQTLSQARE